MRVDSGLELEKINRSLQKMLHNNLILLVSINVSWLQLLKQLAVLDNYSTNGDSFQSAYHGAMGYLYTT